MPKTILVTGANGILAQKMISQLQLNSNIYIYASTRDISKIQPILDNVKYIDNHELFKTEVLRNIDTVLHCAFSRSGASEELYESFNFFKTILTKSLEFNVKEFINISSQSVYGIKRSNPSKYSDDPNPQDCYALTKVFCEEFGDFVTRNQSIKYTNIRLASLVGKEYKDRVINKMIEYSIKQNTISVQNDKNILGYLDIDDAVSGIYSFIINSNSKNWDSIYNLGGKFDSCETILDIAELIQKQCNKYGVQIVLNVTEQEQADKLCWLDSETFYDMAKWKPSITLDISIERIFNDIANSLK